MREDEAHRLFVQGYGLALGLALGAFVSTAQLPWRDAAAAACRVGEVEAGQLSDGACAPLGATAGEERIAVAGIAAAPPPGTAAMR